MTIRLAISLLALVLLLAFLVVVIVMARPGPGPVQSPPSTPAKSDPMLPSGHAVARTPSTEAEPQPISTVAVQAISIPDQTGESVPRTGGKPQAAVTVDWKAKATDTAGRFDLEMRFTALSSVDELIVTLHGKPGAELAGIPESSSFVSVPSGDTRTITGNLTLAGDHGTVVVLIQTRSTNARGRTLSFTVTRDGAIWAPPVKPAGPVVTGDDGERLILHPADPLDH